MPKKKGMKVRVHLTIVSIKLRIPVPIRTWITRITIFKIIKHLIYWRSICKSPKTICRIKKKMLAMC